MLALVADFLREAPILNAAFSEVFTNRPKAVSKTLKKKGAKAALAQARAIAFSKSRAAGGPG